MTSTLTGHAGQRAESSVTGACPARSPRRCGVVHPVVLSLAASQGAPLRAAMSDASAPRGGDRATLTGDEELANRRIEALLADATTPRR